MESPRGVFGVANLPCAPRYLSSSTFAGDFGGCFVKGVGFGAHFEDDLTGYYINWRVLCYCNFINSSIYHLEFFEQLKIADPRIAEIIGIWKVE